MGRCLRSKRLRALLWYAAEGKCQACGCDLPDDWHADHVVPFVIRGRTNVHEMQSLCPTCNLRKGANVVTLRRHQVQFDRILDGLIGGDPVRKIVPIVTPGGGKSLLPVMVANKIIGAGMADFICWVVPRVSLADQAEEEFVDDKFGVNTRGLRIRQATNDVNPCRGTHGFVTTYQAIGLDSSRTVAQAFESSRGILVCDECHHIKEGSQFHLAINPIVERSVLTVFMSGNLSRGDEGRVGILPYNDAGLIDTSAPGWRFIHYGRRDALRDKAKLPIAFAHADGASRWLDHMGNPQEATSLRDAKENASKALFAALKTEYADHLLDECLTHYENHRTYTNPRAKMLVVSLSIKDANRIHERCRKQGFRVGIAVCRSDGTELSEKSREAIKKFKKHGRHCYDILVTVQIAYEGLDVPSITHIACLTQIRSWPWIEQMLDRGTRIDREAVKSGIAYESQKLHAYVPDDPKMMDAIAKIRAEQPDPAKQGADDEEERGGGGNLGGGGTPPDLPPGQDIIPLVGAMTDTRYTGDLGDSQVNLPASAASRISEAMTAQGMIGSPLDFVLSLKRLGVALPDSLLSPGDTEAPEKGFQLGELPPSLEEEMLRKSINDYCARFDRLRGWDWGATNKLIMKNFGKSRADMELSELRQTWAWLQKRCPVREAQ